MSKRHSVNRWIDGPSLLLAVSAVAMWLLWPDLHRVDAAARASAATRFTTMFRSDGVSLYQSPDVFALPSPMGFSGPLLQGHMPEMAGTLPPAGPHFLPYEGIRGESDPLLPIRTYLLRQEGANIVPPIRLAPPAPEGVLRLDETAGPRLRLEPGGCLADRGFSVPPSATLDTNALDAAWFVSLVVDVNEAGAVEHVFLKKGCDDPQINDMVIRWVETGRLHRPGTRCRGQVTVNFGTR